MSGFRIFLALVIFASSCKQQFSKDAFIKWYQGIPPIKEETEDYKLTVRYFPVEILMMDKEVTTEEMEAQSGKIWITLDIDKKRYFPSTSSIGRGHFKKDNETRQNLLITLKGKEPAFKMNEYNIGDGIEGRWILGWDDKEVQDDKLVIKINDISLEIPMAEIIPGERPALKI